LDIGFLVAPTAQSGDLAEIARAVEAHGYESFWIPEHPVIPIAMKTEFPFTLDHKLPEHYGRWADPFVALTVAACATRKIKLGTGICLLPEREPLITAKVTASLDLFSGGRLILGVGAGWLREETEVMGAQFGLRWKRTRGVKPPIRVILSVSRPCDANRSRFRNRARRYCWVLMGSRHSSAWRARTTAGCRWCRTPGNYGKASRSFEASLNSIAATPTGSRSHRWSIPEKTGHPVTSLWRIAMQARSG